MNKEKIRAAINEAINDQWTTFGCKENLRQALAELDKAPKVLTDDMVNTVVNLEKKLHLRENGSDKEADIWARGVMSGMIQARDNGYLAPAAGLTVEEFMDIHRKWLDDVHCYEDWNTNAFTDLRALLTAAIEAKNRKVK